MSHRYIHTYNDDDSVLAFNDKEAHWRFIRKLYTQQLQGRLPTGNIYIYIYILVVSFIGSDIVTFLLLDVANKSLFLVARGTKRRFCCSLRLITPTLLLLLLLLWLLLSRAVTAQINYMLRPQQPVVVVTSTTRESIVLILLFFLFSLCVCRFYVCSCVFLFLFLKSVYNGSSL